MKKRNYILSETEIAKDLRKLSPMGAMDQNAKYFLMHPDILSFILKHTLTEFAALNTAEIQKRIDGVNVQRPSRLKEILQNVQFLNPSDYIPGEGQIIYDLLLSLRIPGEKEGSELQRDLEFDIQNNFWPGYSLITRAIFYVARGFCRQWRELRRRLRPGKKDSKLLYRDLHKFIGIWLCLDAGSKAGNTINKYHITEECVAGSFHAKVSEYDMMEVIMVRLPSKDEDIDNSNKLFSLLSAMFSKTMPLDERKQRMEDCGIQMTEYVERRFETMCNLGEGIRDWAWKEGRQATIEPFLKSCVELGGSYEYAVQKLMIVYKLSESEATRRAQKYYRKSGVQA
ncbi:MAG: hypothetical protein LUE29_14095 [Lachnospiraceae bacterium]|nr:hypothetical protein [Lachnospiraceae bacterium]